jgi:hypothetical protein
MKKWKVTALVVLLCTGMLCGCGGSYAADESTVFVRKDGSVVTTDVEEFDADTYDEAGLKSYVDETISAYNDENGKDSIKRKSLSVKNGKATLTLAYASAQDYQNFTDIELFTGTLAEALAAGYSFDEEFVGVKDGEITACSDTSVFLNESGYKVAIIRGNARVQVSGTIVYMTASNTTWVNKKTILISDGTSIFDAEGSDSTETATEVVGTEIVSTEESTQAQEEDSAMLEDDLLSASEEDTGVVFDFSDEESTSQSEISQVYTYIIYK